MIEVVYLINATGVRVTKEFPSEYLARKFINKLEHSKECTFIAKHNYPF